MTEPSTPWNQGSRVGPRTHFSPADVCLIVDLLRQDQHFHDLCLFTMGIDSMLRCSDLLALRVRDVCDGYGVVRESFIGHQQKTGHEVAPALTITTRDACQRWIKESGKRRDHFLFTRTKPIEDRHINTDTYRTLVKGWANLLRLNPETYSTHSLRRSKPHFMFRRGVEIEYISELLGHQNTATTYRYLGITREEAQERALKHDIFKKSLHRFGNNRKQKPVQEVPDIFITCTEELQTEIQIMRVSIQELKQQVSAQVQINHEQSEMLRKILSYITSLPGKPL